MNRFSKENIDKLVLMPIHEGFRGFIGEIAGPIIDFSGVIGAVILTAAFILTKLSFLLPIIALLIVYQLILFYYIFIKFNKIKVNRYKIDLGVGKEVSFVFASDFHIGNEYISTRGKRISNIIQTINNLDSELVLLGGDFLTHDIEKEMLSEFKHIKAANRFAVYGNHDAEYLEDKVEYNTPQEFLEAFKSTNIPVLINQNANLTINGVNISIAGIPDLYSKTFNIEEAFKGSDNNSIRILMSHNPDVVDFVEDKDNIDLILSGHNHSGQIHFMGRGILPMPTKRKWLTKGVFQISKRTKLFLSQGIGYSGSRLRINTDAEVCLITIY